MLYIYRSKHVLEESGASIAPPKCSHPANPNLVRVPTQPKPVPTRQHCSDNPENKDNNNSENESDNNNEDDKIERDYDNEDDDDKIESGDNDNQKWRQQ